MKPDQINQKEDQRVRLTKKLIRNAFFSLLAEKPINNVTVKALCEAADINRSTFYLHYQDIYDLMHTLQQEMLDDLEALLAENPVIEGGAPQEDTVALMTALFEFFERNHEMCSILLGPNGDKQFVSDIIERGRKKSIKEYQALYPGLSRQRAEIFYQFIAWGFIGLLQHALQNPQGLSLLTTTKFAQYMVAGAAQFLANENPHASLQ